MERIVFKRDATTEQALAYLAMIAGPAHRSRRTTFHPITTRAGQLSVQASSSAYSIPRSDYGPYVCVEVGYPPTRPPITWARYKENKSTFYYNGPRQLRRLFMFMAWLLLWDDVYCYIPVTEVKSYISLMSDEVAVYPWEALGVMFFTMLMLVLWGSM